VTIVDKVNGTPTSDFDSAINDLSSTPSNYVLVDCVDGKCKQTNGFVLVGEDSAYAFAGDSGTGSTAINGSSKIDKYVFDSVSSNCDEANIGKISSSREFICMNGGRVELDSNNVEYIMLRGKAAIDTPFYDSINSIPLKRSSRYIIRDQYYTGGKVFKKKSLLISFRKIFLLIIY